MQCSFSRQASETCNESFPTHTYEKRRKREKMYLRHSKNVTSPLLFRKHIFFANMYKHLLDPFAENIKGRKIPFPPSLFSPNLPNRLTQQLISPSVFSIFGLFKYSHFFCCPPNSHEKEGLKKKFPWQAVRRFPQKSTLRQKKDLKKKSVIFLWGIGWWALFCAQATAKRTSQAF